MNAFYVISSALFAASYAKDLSPSYTPSSADPTITQAPQINYELLRKQVDNRFMGWLQLSDGSYYSQQCDLGYTLFQTADVWRCCTTTAAGCAITNIPVACISGSLIYPAASSGTASFETWACTSLFPDPSDSSFTQCNTGFLYENTQDSSPQTNINCGVKSVNWSYYRQKPAEATPSASTTESSSAPTTASSTTVNPTPTPTPTDDTSHLTSQVPVPTPKKKSQAWIAGAVVGPIIGLALIGGLIFFFARRKKKTPVPPPASAAPSYPASPPPQQYNNYPPPMQQNQHGMAPFGAVKHDSWAPTQASTSPHPPSSPYGAPVQPQQWQPQQQQVYVAPTSPGPPQSGYVDDHGVVKQPQVAERPFSSELDGTSYPPPHQR